MIVLRENYDRMNTSYIGWSKRELDGIQSSLSDAQRKYAVLQIELETEVYTRLVRGEPVFPGQDTDTPMCQAKRRKCTSQSTPQVQAQTSK